MKVNKWYESQWCKNCGREFLINSHQKTKIFCSMECRDKYYKKDQVKNIKKHKPKVKEVVTQDKQEFNDIVELASKTGLSYGILKPWWNDKAKIKEIIEYHKMKKGKQ